MRIGYVSHRSAFIKRRYSGVHVQGSPQRWSLNYDKDTESMASLVLEQTYMPRTPVEFAGTSYFGGTSDQLVVCAAKGQSSSHDARQLMLRSVITQTYYHQTAPFTYGTRERRCSCTNFKRKTSSATQHVSPGTICRVDRKGPREVNHRRSCFARPGRMVSSGCGRPKRSCTRWD